MSSKAIQKLPMPQKKLQSCTSPEVATLRDSG